MISVCMASFNGGEYIKAQLESILAQLETDDELIISDDGSTDETLDIIRKCDDRRIKLMHHDKAEQKYRYAYTAANVENALRNASGDIIYLTDQDDVWLPDKIECMNRALLDADMVLSDCSIVDSKLDVLVPSKFLMDGVRIGALRNLYKCGYLGCCMAFRRELLKYILPLPANVPHDLWIGLIGGYMGRFTLLPVRTLLYRRHDANISSTNNKLLRLEGVGAKKLTPNRNSFSFKIRYRYIVLFHYLKFIVRHPNR